MCENSCFNVYLGVLPLSIMWNCTGFMYCLHFSNLFHLKINSINGFSTDAQLDWVLSPHTVCMWWRPSNLAVSVLDEIRMLVGEENLEGLHV